MGTFTTCVWLSPILNFSYLKTFCFCKAHARSLTGRNPPQGTEHLIFEKGIVLAVHEGSGPAAKNLYFSLPQRSPPLSLTFFSLWQKLLSISILRLLTSIVPGCLFGVLDFYLYTCGCSWTHSY